MQTRTNKCLKKLLGLRYFQVRVSFTSYNQDNSKLQYFLSDIIVLRCVCGGGGGGGGVEVTFWWGYYFPTNLPLGKKLLETIPRG